MSRAFRRTLQGWFLAVGLVSISATLLWLANLNANKCGQVAWLERAGCFLVEYKELVAGLLALDGALFAAWLAWVAVQQQIQVSERDSDLRQIDTLTERSIVLRSEIAELNATRKWAQSTFRSLNKTPYGPGGVIVISPAETRREVIFLDDIGTFALRTNLAQVGPAFNACLTSFHQLADSFRKPNLSDDEMKRLYTASRGNVARLDDWSREIQRLIEQKEQQAKELTEHIALLKKTVGKR